MNAGCRITSIQRFLGHKKLNTTMIYARAHDQNVAEDYFVAMQKVEQKLDIATVISRDAAPDFPAAIGQEPNTETNYEVVKVQEHT